jgi:NADPH-dependent ferric siderophore reductase
MQNPAAQAPKPAHKRRPPRRTQVVKIERVTPRVIRVTFAGDELEGFGPPRPGAHIKLLFPQDASWDHRDPEAPRPPSRTYTPRTYDANANTLAVEFVLHGAGLAAGWVQRAREGDAAYVAGPGGGYELASEARRIVLVADDTAMPAAGTVLEALPPRCEAVALCEIADRNEQRALSANAQAETKWLHLDGAQPGSLLEREVRNLAAPADAHWWVACESGAMRRIRAHLLKERGIEPAHVHTRGYWRLGETNHPDSDYGADQDLTS